MGRRAAELQEVDDARAAFLAHTAVTRVKAERSKSELAFRHADDAEPEERVTAQEWLDAHDQAVIDDERIRQVTEADVATCEQLVVDDAAYRSEVGATDIREVTEAEPRAVDEDAVRIPTADETADSVHGARRSLVEIRAREAADGWSAVEPRAVELAQWHADDETAADEHTMERDLVYGDG